MTSSCSAVSGRSRSRLRVIGIPARSETAVHSASSALCRPSSPSASGPGAGAIIARPCAPRRGDHPPVRRAAARGLTKLLEVAAQLRGRAARERLAAQHQTGEDLTDLVMQLARDPPALPLRGGECPAPPPTPLPRETIEHPVDLAGQRGALPPRRIDLEA